MCSADLDRAVSVHQREAGLTCTTWLSVSTAPGGVICVRGGGGVSSGGGGWGLRDGPCRPTDTMGVTMLDWTGAARRVTMPDWSDAAAAPVA